MQDEVFTLSSNAFRVVGAQYTSTAADIADLVEEAEYSGTRSEATVQKAQQILVTPRLRLHDELGWLPELSDMQLAKVLGELANPSESSITALTEHMPELARANVLADLCSRGAVSTSVVKSLFGSWSTMDSDSTFNFLKSARRVAGFPEPDPKLLRAALTELRGKHAATAVLSLLKGSNAESKLRDIVEDEIAQNAPSPLLSDVIREYERLRGANFARLSDEVSHAIEEARSMRVEIGKTIADIGRVLTSWSRLTDPLVSYYGWKGHAEPRSKALFYQIRGWSLQLANDQGKLEESHALSQLLANNFDRTDELKQEATTDVGDLKNLIDEQRNIEIFLPLYNAVEQAKAAYPSFAKQVKKSGFKSTSTAQVSGFVKAYENFIASGGDVNVAANCGRDLALFVNNDKNDPELAYHVLYFVQLRMTVQTSDEVRAIISTDADTAFRNWKFPVLTAQNGDLSRLIRAIDEILKIAPSGLKGEYESLREDFRQKRHEKNAKNKRGLLVAGVVVAGFTIVAMANQGPGSSTSSSGHASSTPVYTSQTPPRTETPVATQPVRQDFSEVRPPVGNDLVLSINQIRFCVFQGRRLDILRNMTTTNDGVDKFNALINDFNDRCAAYRYRQADMSEVTNEASNRALLFQTDATKIARGW